MSTTSAPTEEGESPDAAVHETTYREAMRAAIRQALVDDERVIVLGEDVADYGGTYGVTRDLHLEFGADRVRNTPLSESAFVGSVV